MINVHKAVRHLLGATLVPGALFVVLLLAAALQSPNLFTANGVTSAILVAAPLILATLALTPIVMAGRGSVDLSIGPLIAFINVTLITWLVGHGVTHPVAIFAWAIGVGAAWQFLQAIAILKLRIAPIVISLSGYLVLSGLDLLIMSRPGGVAPDWMASWGGGAVTTVFSPILLLVLVALVLWMVVSRTGFHTQLRMMGSDERTAYTSGVRTEIVRLLAHVLGGIFAGLAAISYTALISSGDPTQGARYTLQAVTALVLGGASLAGGRGSALGSFLGALNMFLITYLLGSFNFGTLSGYVTQLAFGLILVASLILNMFTAGRRAAA